MWQVLVEFTFSELGG